MAAAAGQPCWPRSAERKGATHGRRPKPSIGQTKATSPRPRRSSPRDHRDRLTSCDPGRFNALQSRSAERCAVPCTDPDRIQLRRLWRRRFELYLGEVRPEKDRRHDLPHRTAASQVPHRTAGGHLAHAIRCAPRGRLRRPQRRPRPLRSLQRNVHRPAQRARHVDPHRRRQPPAASA